MKDEDDTESITPSSFSLSHTHSLTHSLSCPLSHSLACPPQEDMTDEDDTESGVYLYEAVGQLGQFKLPWREAGPPHHHDDRVDSDQ